jgi:hypothetical protein
MKQLIMASVLMLSLSQAANAASPKEAAQEALKMPAKLVGLSAVALDSAVQLPGKLAHKLAKLQVQGLDHGMKKGKALLKQK